MPFFVEASYWIHVQLDTMFAICIVFPKVTEPIRIMRIVHAPSSTPYEHRNVHEHIICLKEEDSDGYIRMLNCILGYPCLGHINRAFGKQTLAIEALELATVNGAKICLPTIRYTRTLKLGT
jgi:hypothetical protein